MDESFRHYLIDGQRAGMRYVLVQPPGAPRGVAGSEMGKGTGASLEFMDHREYIHGDDLRRIDWSAYARSDKLTVKLYREEVCPHLDILIDTSRSMALGGTAKAQATLSLAALLASAADNAGYSHCAWLAGEGCRKVPNGAADPALWEGIDFEYEASPAESLQRLPPAWRPRGIRVLISDLLWLGDPVGMLSLLSRRATSVVVVQLLARADVDPPRHGNVRLIDSETALHQEIFIDAAAQRRYRRALARHQQNWHRACRQVGAVMATVVADRLVRDWRLDELLALEVLKVA